MADAALKLMTVDEFLVWDDGTDTRYELVDGVPVAMAPPLTPHGAIVANVAYEVTHRTRLRPPCRAIAQAGVWVSEHRYFVADVALTCAQPGRSPNVEDASILVEVLSPSTRAHDLGVKLPTYKDLPSVEEIWLIDEAMAKNARPGQEMAARLVQPGRFRSLSELAHGIRHLGRRRLPDVI